MAADSQLEFLSGDDDYSQPPTIILHDDMAPEKASRLRAYENWLIMNPSQRLADLQAVILELASKKYDPTSLSDSNEWRHLLDPSFAFDFDDMTEDTLYAQAEIQERMDKNRKSNNTPEQSRRGLVKLRILRVGGFLLRAEEWSQSQSDGPVRQIGKVSIATLMID